MLYCIKDGVLIDLDSLDVMEIQIGSTVLRTMEIYFRLIFSYFLTHTKNLLVVHVSPMFKYFVQVRYPSFCRACKPLPASTRLFELIATPNARI